MKIRRSLLGLNTLSGHILITLASAIFRTTSRPSSMTMLGSWRKFAGDCRRSVVRRRRLGEGEVRTLLLKTQGHVRGRKSRSSKSDRRMMMKPVTVCGGTLRKQKKEKKESPKKETKITIKRDRSVAMFLRGELAKVAGSQREIRKSERRRFWFVRILTRPWLLLG